MTKSTRTVRRLVPSFIAALGLVSAWSAASAQAGKDPVAVGKALFSQRACSACHSLEPGRDLNGPSLAGVVGRVRGSVAGYRYSPALAGAGGRWDKAQLDRWLADPRALVPETKMAVKVASPGERAAIIAYLAAAGAK